MKTSRFLGTVVVSLVIALGFSVIVYQRHQAAGQVTVIDRMLLTEGELPDWESRLHQTLWWYPHHDQAWLQLGFLLARDDRFAEAASALAHVSSASSFHNEATFARAKALLSDGQYELGEAVLKGHLAEYPRSIEAWDLCYALHAEQFRQDELIESLTQRVLELRTSFQLLPLHLKAVGSSSQAQRVESRLLAVEAKYPGQQCVVAALARAAWLKGERERARMLFQDLSARSELRPRFVLWAAEFYLDTQSSEQAKSLLQRLESSTKLPSEDAATYRFMQARVSSLEGDQEQALVQVDEAIKLKPTSAKLHTLRATILRRLKKVSQAAESNEAAARYGAVDEELYRQSTTIGQTPPAPDVCHRIAKNMRVIGHGDVADAWLRLEQTLRAGPSGGSESDGR